MTTPRRTVMMCHDCCCGTARKHPDLDHESQRDAIRACATDEVRVRTVECLSQCEHSNVVLVREHDALLGAHDTWFGGVLTDSDTGRLADWIARGGAVPALLRPRVFARRQHRRRML